MRVPARGRAGGRSGRGAWHSVAPALLALLGSLDGCAAASRSHDMLGQARPVLAPDAVQVFLEPPSRPYEQIAVVRASSRWSWSFGSQAQAEVVLRRLKEEAAALGANALLLREIATHEGPTVDTLVGGNYIGPRGVADVGVDIPAVAVRRYGWGIAVHMP